jgi:periplasmic copper chaperone A
MTHTRKLAAATAVAMLAVPAAAQAHVTLQPNTAPAGAFMVLDVRVPTERDNASTAKVDVQFPAGFAAASYQAVPGWRVRVIKKRLATPIQTDDGPITEGVSRVVWTRTNRSGGIKPGQFQDFPISVQIPGKAGDKLTFKALQTYSNGEVVRWIGAAGSDQPAPQVTVTAATASGAAADAGNSHGAGGTIVKSTSSTPPSSPAVSSDSSDSVLMAGLGALGALLLGGAFTLIRRRRSSSPAAA